METADKKVAGQIQFWGVVGPAIALVTLSVIILKSSPQALYLSFATIFGILASWKWKVKGLAISTVLVLVLYLYQFSEITPDEHLWHIGINIAIMMGFVITALAYQEVEELVNEKHAEAEAKANTTEIWEAEKETYNRQMEVLRKELAAKEVKIKSYDDLVDLARKEAAKLNSSNEKLVKELLEKQHEIGHIQEQYKNVQDKRKQEIEHLNEKLQQAQSQASNVSAINASVQSLEQALAQKTQEVSELKGHIQEALEQIKSLSAVRSQAQSLENDVRAKNEEVLTLKERVEELERNLAAAVEEAGNLAQHQAMIQEMSEHIQMLTASKEQLEQSLAKIQKELEQKDQEVKEVAPEASPAWLRKLEGMYKQLRLQYDEKSVILDETRKELFLAQEKLLQQQREYEEAQNESIATMDKYLLHIIQESKQATDELQREVDSLQALISSLMRKA